ncbi:LysR family transcriptional regulator [Marinomonas sp. 15G1-11]|uniref:LysR family transcriptional regulator n=1 Tax=Marinomonas phaeophyticola TaxID=3004091 RepID=A0ABT4JWL4_9GAMM|nr:LysR family transcriptional regulator [Marinomonas sp. 15G1-11]MCZ2722640.1 LysR family transcriptional regulator [Marinomonas sp. 15G1-11]
MRFRKLHYFVTVAEELHFGRAAQRLHISQPPLSQQIKSLEDELEATLFDRTSQRVTLTKAGEALLPQAKSLLQMWQNTQEQVKAVSKGEEGNLSVGFIWATGTPHFSKGIGDFKKKYAKATLNLESMSTVDALQGLALDKIDLAFVFLNPSVDVSLFKNCHYEHQDNLLALHEDHPLSNKTEVSLSDLKGESFIMFARSSHPSLYDQIMNSLHAASVQPNIVQIAKVTQTTRTLVAAGVGIAIVPESTQYDQREGLVYRPITDKLPDLEIHMVWKAERETPLMLRFMEHMLEHVNERH